MIEKCERQRRTTEHGHPICSPCEPNGSGELKIGIPCIPKFCYLKVGVREYTLHGHVIVIVIFKAMEL